MNPIEKLIEVCKQAFEEHGQVHTLWKIMDAVDEYESAPKTWSTPWALKIPEWPEVWLAVDRDGSPWFHSSDPVCTNSIHDQKPGSVSNYQAPMGRLQIPPGVDWRTMKVRVR